MHGTVSRQSGRPIRGRRAAGAFTLVELLVVISIISVLIALLLPALKQARHQARKAWAMSQMRQQINGWNVVAQDYKGQLPKGSPRPTNAGPNTWRDNGFNFDLSEQMIEYGFVQASLHPVVDASAYDDPAFTGVSLDQGPWAYFPGWQTDWMKPSHPQPDIEPQPVALDDARPGSVLMQETLQYHPYSNDRRSVYPAAAASISTAKTNGVPRYFFSSGADPEGTHIGRYDASVAWQSFTFIIGGPNNYRSAHIGGNWITALHAEP